MSLVGTVHTEFARVALMANDADVQKIHHGRVNLTAEVNDMGGVLYDAWQYFSGQMPDFANVFATHLSHSGSTE